MINYSELWDSEAPKIYELSVIADANDADYVSDTNKVSEEDIKAMKPIIEMIKNKKGHNWVVGEVARQGEGPMDVYPDLTKDAFEWFSEFIPRGEYGVHTIESIEYYPLPKKVKLL